MTQQELDQLDLELFKVCYPSQMQDNPCVQFDEIMCGSGWSVNRFTKDIRQCFCALIPEMNRREWYLDRLSQCGKAWLAVFVDDTSSRIEEGSSPSEAIAKAADKAIKSTEGK